MREFKLGHRQRTTRRKLQQVALIRQTHDWSHVGLLSPTQPWTKGKAAGDPGRCPGNWRDAKPDHAQLFDSRNISKWSVCAHVWLFFMIWFWDVWYVVTDGSCTIFCVLLTVSQIKVNGNERYLETKRMPSQASPWWWDAICSGYLLKGRFTWSNRGEREAVAFHLARGYLPHSRATK